MNMEYVGPKRLIDQVFNRPASASAKKLPVNTLPPPPVRPLVTGRSISTRSTLPPISPYVDRSTPRPTPLRAATRV